VTFNVPSFFVGVGTVLLTLVVGFGGGVLMTGAFTDRPREQNKVERRVNEDAKPAPAPVIVASPVPAAAPVQAAPAHPAPLQAAPPARSAAPAAAQPAERPQAPAEPPKPVQQAEPRVAPASPPQQAADQTALGPQRPVSLTQPQEPARAAQDASRKAQEAKARAERRKAERRKQIAEQRMRRQQQQAVQERPHRDASADDDDEDRAERPIFSQRERGIEPPPFRLFKLFGD
jgi:hypothetical protein